MNQSSQAKKVIRYYWRHATVYPSLVLGLLFSVPLTVLINSFLPSLIIANILSRLSEHHYGNNIWHDFGPLLIVYFLLVSSGIWAWRLVDWFAFRLEGKIERDLARQVFSHMLDESADFHANNFSGSLVSQNNKLLSGYIRIADTSIFQVMPMIVGIVFAAVILGLRVPVYGGLLIVFAVLFIVAALRISRPVRVLSAQHAANESAQTGYLADAITNVMAIKSFAQGSYERRRFAAVADATEGSLLRFMHVQGRLFNYMGAISRVISTIAVLMGIFSVVVLKVNIGTVFLMLTYTSTIVDQLFNFSNSSLRNYNRSVGDAADMIGILAQTPSILDPVEPEVSRIKKGAVTFQNVIFQHQESSDAIFQDLSVQIKPGEKVGLVGHSGSGKTTFTRLLLRFSDIDEGAILIDGQNIAHITQDDLHARIAYVPQEPVLFHRTIAENIGYGKMNASLGAIKRVAKHAHAAEFIDLLPKGYNTLVGERGVKLSGGQRQRVAIARAMLKNAPILVLDEATSALDSESEVLIQDALWKLMEGRTAIVIAHRLSTIQKMDRIVVLEEGKIVEQGTHKELLRAKGTYAKLWAHQSGGFMED